MRASPGAAVCFHEPKLPMWQGECPLTTIILLWLFSLYCPRIMRRPPTNCLLKSPVWAQAEEAVERVFSQCFKDTRPFDRIP
mmetsp:Transcript_25175/g.70389  ORF Transcript_25175/g.70389 Transcript_25175/m.70389 type:complete len:82 (-) Transcript_25175:659-904(-)